MDILHVIAINRARNIFSFRDRTRRRSAMINQRARACVRVISTLQRNNSHKTAPAADDALVDANWVGRLATDPWSGVYVTLLRRMRLPLPRMTCRSRRTISYRLSSVFIHHSPAVNFVNFLSCPLRETAEHRLYVDFIRHSSVADSTALIVELLGSWGLWHPTSDRWFDDVLLTSRNDEQYDECWMNSAVDKTAVYLFSLRIVPHCRV